MNASIETYRGRHVLITGGLGFIGSNLARRLVEMGADVSIVDSLIPGYGGNLFNIDEIKDRVTVHLDDVRDQPGMERHVAGKQYLFNLAGTLSHIDSMRDPFTDLEINVRSQLSILEACRKQNRDVKIVYTGTRGQYGKAQYLPVDERHPLHPTDINGIHNNAGEMYHLLYHEVYGIRATCLRLSNTYGPRHQMRHPRQGIINWFVRQILDGETVGLFGDGKQIRDANYVDDVVEALLLAMASDRADGGVYNLGGDHLTLGEIVQSIIRLHGSGSFVQKEFQGDLKKIEIGDYVADTGKIRSELGWTPSTGFDEGMRRTLEFYRAHRGHYWKKGERQ